MTVIRRPWWGLKPARIARTSPTNYFGTSDGTGRIRRCMVSWAVHRIFRVPCTYRRKASLASPIPLIRRGTPRIAERRGLRPDPCRRAAGRGRDRRLGPTITRMLSRPSPGRLAGACGRRTAAAVTTPADTRRRFGRKNGGLSVPSSCTDECGHHSFAVAL
jgi:hypothetical protein